MRVYLRHMKAPGLSYCNRGGRDFFKARGWSWSDFLRNGIDAEILIATEDAMALRAVDVAKREQASGR